jgi:hypothetical protein
MTRHLWRFALSIFVALAVAVPAGLAFACVGIMSLTTEVTRVEPGGTVPVLGRSFAQGAPITIHLDSPAGPVLATAPAPMSTMTSQFTIDVVIPADTPRGQHLLVAVQNYHQMNAGAPARASIQVGSDAPVLAEVESTRPTSLAASSGPSTSLLLLVGLGVAALALMVAGFASLLASRSKGAPETAKVSS